MLLTRGLVTSTWLGLEKDCWCVRSHWTGTRLLGEGPEQVRCLDALTSETVVHHEDAKGFVCVHLRCRGKWQNVQIHTDFCLSFGWSFFWGKQNFCKQQQPPKGCCQIISPLTCSCAAPHELTPPSKCSCYSSVCLRIHSQASEFLKPLWACFVNALRLHQYSMDAAGSPSLPVWLCSCAGE